MSDRPQPQRVHSHPSTHSRRPPQRGRRNRPDDLAEVVVESKLHEPRSLGVVVPRPQLLRAMARDVDRGCKVTMISAPAGAGKTMLLAQRGQQLRAAGVPVAWLSLDEQDNDPTILWSDLLAACSRAVREGCPAAAEALGTLSASSSRTPDRGFLGALFAALEPLPHGLHIVLDDAHEIVASDALGELGRLLKGLPAQHCVLLGCRFDPPLPIPRMIVEGTASELRIADLAFNRDDARELLQGHGVELTDRDLELLLTRTEGWAAGLRLAVMSLQHQDDLSGYIARFAGNDRPVADYLVSEVLATYPDEIIAFLLATAIPDELTIDLAAELSGRTDSGAILERLAHDNALVSRPDASPASYRYHTLLRSYLLAELSRRDASATGDMHRVAAEWYLEHDTPAAALDHATRGRDWDRVAELLDGHALRLLMNGDSASLTRALTLAPANALDSPGMVLVAAIAALQNGRLAAAEFQLDRVGRDPFVHDDPRLAALHAGAIGFEARLSGRRSLDLIELIEKASELKEHRGDRLLELFVAANRGMLRALRGEFARAEQDLTGALRLAEEVGAEYVTFDCLAHLAYIASGRGDFAELETRAGEAIAYAVERGWSSCGGLPGAYLAAAWAAWQGLDLVAADRNVSMAAAIDVDVEPETSFSTRIVGAFVDFARGKEGRAALVRLRSTWSRAAPGCLNAQVIAAFCLTEVQMALSIAEPSWATESAARAERLIGETGDVQVMRAWTHVHHGRDGPARSALGPVLSGELCCHAVSSEIMAWLLEAHLADTNGAPERSHQAAVRAVELAAPRRAMRDLSNASMRVRRLLVRNLGRFGTYNEFVREVLDVTRPTIPRQRALGTVAGEALTEREAEVLRDLPSMLSQAEIARAHVVSVNTVRTHLKALYRKLAVNSRRGAVERARELGLL